MTRYVSYIRVSTTAQGRSGLGLDAQRDAVARYIGAGPFDFLAEFVEVETGKGANALARRPQLAAAIALAKRNKAVLVIAKLDRLARNVHFISGLMETGVEFIAVDTPHASRLTLHIMAAFAEHEREMISVRTKQALQAAKARGTVLGAHGQVQALRNKAEASQRLDPVSDRLRQMRAEGLSVRSIAATLNREKVPSPGGGLWHPSNTQKALTRIAA